MKQYSLSYLESLPTLSQGQFDDLKIEKKGMRVWLSRMTKEDGEPYDNCVTVEKYMIYAQSHFYRHGLPPSGWVIVDKYPAL